MPEGLAPLPYRLYLLSCLQGYIPRGIDQSYIAGFLAREIERAAARATETTTNSSGASGAVLLSKVVSKYGQLMGVDHLALALHKLAELQEEGVAGSAQVCGSARLACSAAGVSVDVCDAYVCLHAFIDHSDQAE